MIARVLGSCAAGLCARYPIQQHHDPQHAVANGDLPVIAHEAPTDNSDPVGYKDQQVHPNDMHMQAHTRIDSLYSSSKERSAETARDDEGQTVATDAISLTSSSCQGCLGDVGSADSEGTWNVAPSAPANVLEHVEKDDDAATRHQAMEAEHHHQPSAEQVCTSFEPQADERSPCEGQSQVCSSFKPLAAAEAVAAQGDPVSAKIVGFSGKFYTIELHAANQGDLANSRSKSLTRRFRQFAALDNEIRPRHPAIPRLPQKSVFFRKNFKRGFLDEREQQLGAYLSALLANPSTLAEPSVRRFLGLSCEAHA